MSFYDYLPSNPEQKAKQMGAPLFFHQYAKNAREYLQKNGYDCNGKTDREVWEASAELHEEQTGGTDNFLGSLADLTSSILAITPAGKRAAEKKAELERQRLEAERQKTERTKQTVKMVGIVVGGLVGALVLYKVLKR